MEVLVALLVLAFSFTLLFGGITASHRLMLKAKKRAETLDQCSRRIQEARLLGEDLVEEEGAGGKLQGKGVLLEFTQRPFEASEDTYWIVTVRCREKGTFAMEAPLP